MRSNKVVNLEIPAFLPSKSAGGRPIGLFRSKNIGIILFLFR